MNVLPMIVYSASLVLCCATYFLYPLAIMIASRIRPFRTEKREVFPFLSIIITAYNEEKHIGGKIRNTLDLDYPRDRMEIIVASDGSRDGTAGIARGYASRGVRLLDFPENRGKTTAQNDAVAASRGEILVFTDAASFINRDAVRAIARNFADPRIGCVAGTLRYVNTDENITTQSQGIYWRYELKIRELESRLGSLIGVDGPLYAIRRDAFVRLGGHVISDFILPLLVRASGKKVVLETEAVADEDPTTGLRQEMGTRRRITVRALVGLASHADLLDPLKHPALAVQIFLHKLVRWFVGPLLVLNLLATVLLFDEGLVFRLTAVAYLLLIGSAFAGMMLDRFHWRWRPFMIPYYFVLVNYSAVLGILDFFRKKHAVRWEPVRS